MKKFSYLFVLISVLPMCRHTPPSQEQDSQSPPQPPAVVLNSFAKPSPPPPASTLKITSLHLAPKRVGSSSVAELSITSTPPSDYCSFRACPEGDSSARCVEDRISLPQRTIPHLPAGKLQVRARCCMHSPLAAGSPTCGPETTIGFTQASNDASPLQKALEEKYAKIQEIKQLAFPLAADFAAFKTAVDSTTSDLAAAPAPIQALYAIANNHLSIGPDRFGELLASPQVEEKLALLQAYYRNQTQQKNAPTLNLQAEESSENFFNNKNTVLMLSTVEIVLAVGTLVYGISLENRIEKISEQYEPLKHAYDTKVIMRQLLLEDPRLKNRAGDLSPSLSAKTLAATQKKLEQQETKITELKKLSRRVSLLGASVGVADIIIGFAREDFWLQTPEQQTDPLNAAKNRLLQKVAQAEDKLGVLRRDLASIDQRLAGLLATN